MLASYSYSSRSQDGSPFASQPWETSLIVPLGHEVLWFASQPIDVLVVVLPPPQEELMHVPCQILSVIDMTHLWELVEAPSTPREVVKAHSLL